MTLPVLRLGERNGRPGPRPAEQRAVLRCVLKRTQHTWTKCAVAGRRCARFPSERDRWLANSADSAAPPRQAANALGAARLAYRLATRKHTPSRATFARALTGLYTTTRTELFSRAPAVAFDATLDSLPFD